MAKHYRQIWIDAYGPIPKDENGRSFEIHHIDGNRDNNNLNNLKCISIQEHYDIHLLQGDFGAAKAIALRMKTDQKDASKTLSLLNSKTQKKLIKEGRHNFHHKRSELNRQRIAKGLHPFLQSSLQKELSARAYATPGFKEKRLAAVVKSNSERLAKGAHNLQGSNNPNKKKYKCIECGRVTNKGSFTRFFPKCKPANKEEINK